MPGAIASGQLATTDTGIYTCSNLNWPGSVSISLRNTSASLTETIFVYLTPLGVSERQIGRAVLAPNEQYILKNLPIGNGDKVSASTSDATTVDYLVLPGSGGNFEELSLDANGAIKQVNTGVSGAQTISGNLTVQALLIESVADALTAVGTTQGGALALTKEINTVATSSATTAPYNGVTLPASVASTSGSLDIIVINTSANPIQVYGLGADTINGQTSTVGVTQMANSVCLYCSTNTGKWQSEGLGGGYAASLQTLYTSPGLTALGGGQGGALLLPAMVNRITTCGVGNGVVLPTNALGLPITVTNDGANALSIYPDTGAAINSLGTNNPTLLPVGATAIFNCEAANVWKTTLFPPREVSTGISTAGAGTLTAAAIVGGVINRTGPSAAYSDTVDTAANIILGLHGAAVGQSWEMKIQNTVAFNETILTAAGVTLSGNVVVPPLSVGTFLVTVASASTVTINGISTSPLTTPPITAQGTLTTVGAGTILAATVAGGLLLRTGPTAAFTDTTDTGTLIAGAVPNIQIGESFLWTYQNNTYNTGTLTGGVGVNANATFATVGPGSWITVLFTYTAANTFSTKIVASGANFGGLPAFQLSTGTTTGTFAAGQLTGAQDVTYTSTATTPGTITTRTATQMFADIPGAFVGMSWRVRIINNSSGANTLTVAADASVTLSGKTTYTATQYAFIDFLMTFTSATAATMKWVGSGVGPAVN